MLSGLCIQLGFPRAGTSQEVILYESNCLEEMVPLHDSADFKT